MLRKKKIMEKIVKTEELEKGPVSGFGCLWPRKKNNTVYDEFYVHKEVKEYCEKTGEGKYDFIIKKEVVETKEPIKEVINSQADQVGIEAYMRQCIAEGMNPEEMTAEVKDAINDFTYAPETLADALSLNDIAKKKFEALPEDLRGKCGNYQEFASFMSDKMLDEWVNSKLKKKEDEPNGGNNNG